MRRGFTASYSSSEWSSQNTVSRYLRERPRRPSQNWRTFLANRLGQFTVMSQVLSPYASRDDIVDAFAKNSCAAPSSDQLPASRQCALADWPASVRCIGLGALCIQDHLPDRISMR